MLLEKVRGAGEICLYKGLLFPVSGRSGIGAAWITGGGGDVPFVTFLLDTLPELLPVSVCLASLSDLTKMDSASKNSGPAEQPTGSLLNALSFGFFRRDRSASSDIPSARLTSFKELPDGENPLPADENSELQDIHQDDGTASCDTRQRAESSESYKESSDQVKTATGASVDPDLVQVTRVETYSDTENEDESTTGSSSRLLETIARARKNTLPAQDNNKVDYGDGHELKESGEADEEYQIPSFRTHNVRERSLVESILFKTSRFSGKSGSKTAEQGDDCSLKESPSTMHADVEKSSARKISDDNVRADESDEYTAVDCSLPVPSIISGHLTLEDAGCNSTMASPLRQMEDLDHIQKEEPDESHYRLVSSTVPLSPETPEEQSDSTGITNQTTVLPSTPKESPVDFQPSATTSPNTPPPASSITRSPNSSTSSPSKGTSLSPSPSFQMPALFSGLRVLKKGAVGEERETMSEIKQREKDADLALLNLKKSVNKAKLYPEQKTASPTKKLPDAKPATGTKSLVMGQLSHLLGRDSQDETKKSDSRDDDDDPNTKKDTKKSEEGKDVDPKGNKESETGEEVVGEKPAGAEAPASTPEKKKTSDLAYETFRNIFGPKAVKKEKMEDVDLEAVKKKIKTDKENLRSIFERASKSPGKDRSPTEANV